MTISKIKLYIDLENFVASKEFGSNQCNLYLIADNIVYPNKNYLGLPVITLRWMLKELRLLVSRSNTKKERFIYFYPEINNYYIQFEMIDNEHLKIILFKRVIKKTPILHTYLSKDGKIEKTELYCTFNEFFKEVYENSLLVYDICSKKEVLNGDVFVLQQQLISSKSLYNKIVKTI
ncbi:MAG: hypothetical protein K0R05_3790 [Anaerocolumna sp.]|jgi:hypothetical protein|nr:hypothetical protein [Anaerocolumna sp.]